MLGKHHVVTSVSLMATGTFLWNVPMPVGWLTTPTLLLATGVGALVPDIDHQKSLISKKIKVPLYKLFHHRGLTHSWLGWLVWVLILSVVFSPWLTFDTLWTPSLTISLYWGLMVGYLLHLLEDSWSQAGILWLAPFTKHDDYMYQRHHMILRPVVYYLPGATYRSKKIPVRHRWGRGYQVGSPAELQIVLALVALMVVSILKWLFWGHGAML